MYRSVRYHAFSSISAELSENVPKHKRLITLIRALEKDFAVTNFSLVTEHVRMRRSRQSNSSTVSKGKRIPSIAFVMNLGLGVIFTGNKGSLMVVAKTKRRSTAVTKANGI